MRNIQLKMDLDGQRAVDRQRAGLQKMTDLQRTAGWPKMADRPKIVESVLERRVKGLISAARRFPQGSRLPPYAYPLLGAKLFPFVREPSMVAKYIYPDQIYNVEVNMMSRLKEAAPEKAFFCVSGDVYRNLRELHAGLLMMRDEHFKHHVTDEKNDFANWVQDVFDDAALAAAIRGVRSRALAAYRVAERIRQLRRQKV
jgi:hypothetical protein